jgi:Xaa-Pro aminopeptidase
MSDSIVLHPISDTELERRWRLVRAAMRQRDIDVLVVQATQDWLGGYLKWFTDHPATNGYPTTLIFPREGSLTLIEQGPMGVSRDLSDDPIHRGVGKKRYTSSFSSVHYSATYDAQIVLEELRLAGYRRVGLVATAQMQYDFCRHLKQSLPADAVVDATDLVDDLKAIKSPEEQGLIRAAAHLQDQVIAAVASWVVPGKRDFEVAAFAQHVAQDLGSEQGIFLGCSARLGQPAAFRPRHEKGRTLGRGEHFSLLVEVSGPGGYYTEIGRIFVLGKSPPFLRAGLESVKEAQRYLLGLLKPGAECPQIFAAFNEYMRARGLPEEKRLNAHGQGYDMVERPLIRDDETMRLAADMSIVVHPGIMTPQMFAVVCDNYLIGPEGPGACLHRTPQDIIEL